MNKREIVITNSIGDITHTLEARITELMNEFARLEKELVDCITEDNTDIEDIKNPNTLAKLNECLDIFIELKPIERLIRYKYVEFNKMFDQLAVVEGERVHGKFFSFLLCLPSMKRTYKKKNAFIERSRIGTSKVN